MPERPCVVWDALLLRPRPTGVGRAILELAEALSCRERGLAFAVLTTYPEMFSFLRGRSGWRVIPCPAARGGTLRKALFTQLVLPRLVRQLGGRLLHCHQFVGPLRPPCPLVVTVHDLGYLHYPHAVQPLRRMYYRLGVPRTLAASTEIVTNSRATAEDVSRQFPGVASRITPTPFGTPTWVYQQPSLSADRSEGAPFLFVGTLEPRKNLERLLEAYRIFLDRSTEPAGALDPPELVLVGGQGWHDTRLRGLMQPLLERGKLRLTGYCHHDQLWHWYGSARALLFPSLHEGFGFPVLEAMAAKLPVLTSNRGALQEVAGEAALLVNPEDPADIAAGLSRLHLDAELRKRLVTAGSQRVQAWTWDRTAEMTVAVYERSLAGGTAKVVK